MSITHSSSPYRSKLSYDSRTSAFYGNIEEDLSKFVSQIESNTFSIISTRKKLTLISKNNEEFVNEASEKLQSFSENLIKISDQFSSQLQRLSDRITNMEQLSYRPHDFYPTCSIDVGDAHNITCCSAFKDGYICGTDTSRVFVINERDCILTLIKELGPLDESQVLSVGSYQVAGTVHICAHTSSNILYIIDMSHFSNVQKYTCVSFACSYSLLVISSGENVTLISDKQHTLPFKASHVCLCGDSLGMVVGNEFLCVSLDDMSTVSWRREIGTEVHFVVSGSNFFCVSGKGSGLMSVLKENSRFDIPIAGHTSHLAAMQNFIFRCNQEPHIECHDSGKHGMPSILCKDMQPLSASHQISTFCLGDRSIALCQDSRMVVWS